MNKLITIIFTIFLIVLGCNSASIKKADKIEIGTVGVNAYTVWNTESGLSFGIVDLISGNVTTKLEINNYILYNKSTTAFNPATKNIIVAALFPALSEVQILVVNTGNWSFYTPTLSFETNEYNVTSIDSNLKKYGLYAYRTLYVVYTEVKYGLDQFTVTIVDPIVGGAIQLIDEKVKGTFISSAYINSTQQYAVTFSNTTGLFVNLYDATSGPTITVAGNYSVDVASLGSDYTQVSLPYKQKYSQRIASVLSVVNVLYDNTVVLPDITQLNCTSQTFISLINGQNVLKSISSEPFEILAFDSHPTLPVIYTVTSSPSGVVLSSIDLTQLDSITSSPVNYYLADIFVY